MHFNPRLDPFRLGLWGMVFAVYLLWAIQGCYRERKDRWRRLAFAAGGLVSLLEAVMLFWGFAVLARFSWRDVAVLGLLLLYLGVIALFLYLAYQP